jgi:hypothetical protein
MNAWNFTEWNERTMWQRRGAAGECSLVGLSFHLRSSVDALRITHASAARSALRRRIISPARPPLLGSLKHQRIRHTMAVDMFIKIDTVDGEAHDSKHKKEIDVLSWSWA